MRCILGLMIAKPSKLQLMNKKARRDEMHQTSLTQNNLNHQDHTKELSHHSKPGLVKKERQQRLQAEKTIQTHI
jgi:hypothetical protein